MVQGVVKLGSKLRMLRFPDCKIFIQREIYVIRIRTDQDAAAGISKGIFCCLLECGLVEPLMDAALSPGQVGLRQNLVRAIRPCAPCIRPAGTRCGEAETAAQRVDAAEMPAADNLVDSRVGATREPPPFSKGKHIVISKGPAKGLVLIA